MGIRLGGGKEPRRPEIANLYNAHKAYYPYMAVVIPHILFHNGERDDFYLEFKP
jgi:hypothetical protein